MLSSAEPVGVARTGSSLIGLVDPDQRKIYLDPGVDVQRGDVLGFRTWTRMALSVQSWQGAGLVVEFEDGPSLLPDLGLLERRSGTTWDQTSNQNTDTWGSVWSGPCRVDSAASISSGGSNIGEQEIQTQPFQVTFPLSVIDVEPGDRLTVTASRDGRLLVRKLTVQRTLAASLGQERLVLAREEQT